MYNECHYTLTTIIFLPMYVLAYISVEPTWISSDAEVKKESLDDQQDVRHTQTDQACVHLPAEAKHLIGELCIHSDLQQDMQIDEHVVPAIRRRAICECPAQRLQAKI